MFLDRIQIDSHGPLSRIHLGPFAQTLTAIIAAGGTGKTALVRFLRDSLTGTTPAREGMQLSRGTVTWTAADGFYHCRREPNGSTEGRRFVEFEPRHRDTLSSLTHGRDSVVVDLPAAVVDGIVTDTSGTRVSRCVEAAYASGLDQHASAHDSSRDIEIVDLRREIADLERQIHSHTLHSQHAAATARGAYDSFGLTLDMKRLRDRRAELALEISAIDARRDWATKADAEMQRRRQKRETFAAIADDVNRLRRHESDLKTRLAEVESSLAKMDEDAARADNRASIAKAYRIRLEQVETQLNRVRSVVREIRALGDHWFGGRGVTARAGWIEQTIDDIDRTSDHMASVSDFTTELDIVDRGWSASNLQTSDFVDAVRPSEDNVAGSVDVHRRIDAICRIIDNLVGRCEEHQANRVEAFGGDEVTGSGLATRSDAGMPDDPADLGERFEPTRGLDRAERLLREERTYRGESLRHADENIGWIASVLNGISQRLRGLVGYHAAYGASNIDPLFHHRDETAFADSRYPGMILDPHSQMAAVRRCEREIIDAMRQLVNRRDVMLRRIAEMQNQPFSQVVSSLSDGQTIHDDPLLYQWIVRDRIVATQADAKHREAAMQRAKQQRTDLATELTQTAQRLTDRVAEAETIRLYLRSLPVVHRYDNDAELRSRLVAETRAIDAQLATPRVHPTVLQRHARCVSRLRQLSGVVEHASSLATAASEYLQRLSGNAHRSVTWHRGATASAAIHVEIDGRSELTCNPAQRFVAALAVRLAASDELARRGRPLPVIIETPSMRNVGHEPNVRGMWQSIVDTLGSMSRRGRQIIVLTDDAVVADAISRSGGASMWMGKRRETIVTPMRSISNHESSLYDVNHDFDRAWQESIEEIAPSRSGESRHASVPVPTDENGSQFDRVATDRGRDESRRHSVAEHSSEGRVEAIDVPFFLTGASPVDQGPSIDARSAQRLRDIGVMRVEHLLAASPKELAASMAMESIDAATVRRWQNECRLVCGVRHLRPFNARVLVGSGITHPRELVDTDAETLAERIEIFLVTPRGESLKQTASAAELSRLSDWISQARSRSSKKTSTTTSTSTSTSAAASPSRSTSQTTSTRTTTSRLANVRRERESGSQRNATQGQTRETSRSQSSHEESNGELKFYLQRSSDVEAGPSIGPRMAERLYAIGVRTVEALTTRSAESIAGALKLSRVDAGIVRQWQQQATLVCCVPMLRGHDAQLLVAAGITDAQRLAACEPSSLLRKIDVVVNGREGKTILRGGKTPDLAEMNQWISNAAHQRPLVAA